MKRAVAVSPHPGDAVLSCGATLAGLAAGGWHVTLVTVFRRPEDAGADRTAAGALGLGDAVGLALASAGERPDESAAARVAAALGPVLDAERADRVFAPLSTGAGADAGGRVVLDALRWLDHPAPVVLWRDAAAALRGDPAPARPLPDERGIPVGNLLERKLDACAAYAARFGGEAALRSGLVALHEAEGRRLGVAGPAEALVEPVKDTRKRRPGADEDDKAALVRALRGGLGLTR